VTEQAGTVDLGLPGTGEPVPEATHTTLHLGRDYSVWLFDVGLACCAVEFVAASLDPGPLDELGVHPHAGTPERADVLVVSGTVTDKLAPVVRGLYDRMAEPRHVISFGSCSNSGGPYWDSYCVVKGVDTVLPVDLYIPGCPPRPETLVEGLRTLDRLLTERQAS
jgi:NADH-quinone oxidoreductase subunit B